MLTLDKIKPGEEVTIIKVHGQGPVRKRILEMGLSKHTSCQLVRVAPLGDPIEMIVRGYNLSIRKDEAKNIEVTYGE